MNVGVPRGGAKLRIVARLAIGAAAITMPVYAEVPTATPLDAQQRAEVHYQRARELYQAGSYRETAAELEAAHALDPNAKELVFNLGVVNEKLGRIDLALQYFRTYAQMESLTAQERQKAESFVRRLEGAKREIVPPPAPPPAKKDAEPEKGRIDAATVIAGSIAVVGFGVGATFGIKALADRPKASFVTGRDGTYDDLQKNTDLAHKEAIVADIGFGVGVVAAAITAYLYFARTKVTAISSSRAQVSASPLRGGGVFVLQGAF